MRLINQYFDQAKADKDAQYLRSKGIKVFISSKKSHSLGSNHTGAFRVGLWVVYNHQQQDAIACMQNKNHKVVHRLTAEQMRDVSVKNRLNRSQASVLIIKYGLMAFLFMLTIIALLLYFQKIKL